MADLKPRDENSPTWFRYGMVARAMVVVWDWLKEAEKDPDQSVALAMWDAYCTLEEAEKQILAERISEMNRVCLNGPEVATRRAAPPAEEIKWSVTPEMWGEM